MRAIELQPEERLHLIYVLKLNTSIKNGDGKR